jgi:hypothetical protein
MSFIEVFWTDNKTGEFWQRGRRAKSTLLHVLNFVVRDKVLCYTCDGQAKRLRDWGVIYMRSKKKFTPEISTNLLHQTIWFEFVTVRETAHQGSLSLLVHRRGFTLGSAERLTFRLGRPLLRR